MPDQHSETTRLEALWSGKFGDEYAARNAEAGAGRDAFWRGLLERRPYERILEIGCNVGGNLRWIVDIAPPQQTYGVDVNLVALQQLRQTLPVVNSVWGTARELPFRDGWFDLVFTAGVLIHQPDASLTDVMDEAARCSRRDVLMLEYYAADELAVPYRGQEGALFKRDYGRIFADRFPDFALIEEGDLSREDGWDDVRYWLFTTQR